MIGLTVVFLTCDLNKKTIEWVPTLDDTTVYGLTKQIGELRQNLENFQQFQKKGQRAKASEEMKMLGKGLENLDNYYLPLINAKAHLSSAYKLTLRKDLKNLKRNLTNLSNKSWQLKVKQREMFLKTSMAYC